MLVPTRRMLAIVPIPASAGAGIQSSSTPKPMMLVTQPMPMPVCMRHALREDRPRVDAEPGLDRQGAARAVEQQADEELENAAGHGVNPIAGLDRYIEANVDIVAP